MHHATTIPRMAHLRHRHPTRPTHEGARHSKEGARRPGPPGWAAAVPHEHVLRSLAAAHRLRIQSAACSPPGGCTMCPVVLEQEAVDDEHSEH